MHIADALVTPAVAGTMYACSAAAAAVQDTTAILPDYAFLPSDTAALVKFILTIGYIVVAVSFPKYDLIGLLGMAVYLIAGFLLAELSFGKCLRRQDLVYLFIWCVLFAVLRKVPVILWVGRTHRGKWKCLILWKM